MFDCLNVTIRLASEDTKRLIAVDCVRMNVELFEADELGGLVCRVQLCEDLVNDLGASDPCSSQTSASVLDRS